MEYYSGKPPNLVGPVMQNTYNKITKIKPTQNTVSDQIADSLTYFYNNYIAPNYIIIIFLLICIVCLVYRYYNKKNNKNTTTEEQEEEFISINKEYDYVNNSIPLDLSKENMNIRLNEHNKYLDKDIKNFIEKKINENPKYDQYEIVTSNYQDIVDNINDKFIDNIKIGPNYLNIDAPEYNMLPPYAT